MTLEVIFIFIAAYLLGSIPSGLIVGKAFYGIDIREHGSGNLGGTNTFRTLGKKAGFIVTIADILKGTLAALLPFFFDLGIHQVIVGIFAVIGHMYPIFAGFKGGKAVATSAGVVLAFVPLMFAVVVVVFLISLFITQYVSLSSMIGGIVALICALIIGDPILITIVAIMTIFIIYRHRTNISRILQKTEPKVNFFRKH
ncbi:acyl phosphate:glycerol-3-phosphate acyltransferase [Cytobacillus horneckiae]|uniref:Glycerol-3-phosphate acyltransferase n=1 Tax=Cytobacillus horneckiae TaxID=549687 RepID=A0A2N0ZIL4_9BACI|nr:glycerol-3-phosphate 1-O-acyltransferase PlsY [Cytobacillus horneckiae]MBN6886697.1 glycerol-3-phosphate 1-O-acyltransferase PlsY [Cytobacillus horneckiae]MCM3177832.1 glycerol-3-phosphate 1-O-acyltransferase PlsY [Cytobacillus horneckiae]MEC1157362.1 glycerol-3-phosphate 1-O-acyltransferase PlsY [Cytobacillus horneckiae]MED2935757.1 glycerol-3-phosphate 1-O-acyltransferase PlsY [Cytobacillus horneckiae]PKG29343.1 glycerol-3-phosphate 1-O-acyltransferase PlsY [Cytobacillus horneckiae]